MGLILVSGMKQVTGENEVIKILMTDKTKKVNLGFTPININGFEKNMLNDDDNTLFILKGMENIFEDNNLMLPVLSHA